MTPHSNRALPRGRAAAQLNALTGTIPARLCGPDTQLRVLNLRANRLSGPAGPVTRCQQLASLDLGLNNLTGSLPATKVRLAGGLTCGLCVPCSYFAPAGGAACLAACAEDECLAA